MKTQKINLAANLNGIKFLVPIFVEFVDHEVKGIYTEDTYYDEDDDNADVIFYEGKIDKIEEFQNAIGTHSIFEQIRVNA